MADEGEHVKYKPPLRTLQQWKPPASATEPGISVERVREVLSQEATPLPPSGTVRESNVEAAVAAEVREPLPFARTETSEAGHQPAPTADEPAALAVGDIIGDRYVVEQHVSSGGFGAVYRASDRQIRNHQVAVKLLHAPAASDAEREAQLRELTLIASVSHPSVVQFKDYGWQDGRLWFAMPWYRGTTLDQRIGSADDPERPAPMSRAEARPIFERLAQGLAAMHDVGIYHHDIKPENVFLADIAGFSSGLPVLLDLGIAAKRGEKPKGLTIEYAAPETAAAALGDSSRPIGAAADVFSLALVLRNLLDPATMPKLDADNPVALLQRRANEPVEPPNSRDLRYLRPHFVRWLSLDPAERPTASELAEQFAVLTEPEEKRRARLRFLSRLVPVLLIAGGLVAALGYQLEQQESQLSQQAKQLTAKKRESDQLRRQSEEQLRELEQREGELGSERQRLENAIGIARNLDKQLARAEKEADTLGSRADRLQRDKAILTQEKAQLTGERDALTGERDQLRGIRDRLTNERDALTAERNALTAERERLERERNTLDARAKDLSRERDALSADLNDERRARETAARERDSARARENELERELQGLRAQSRDLSRRVGELEADKERIEAIRRSLERQISQLERNVTLRQGATAPTPVDPEPSANEGDEPEPAPVRRARSKRQ